MTEFQLNVVSALIGTAFGALSTLITTKVLEVLARRRRARALYVALWEELSTVKFFHSKQPNFVGFSSQTFDSQFADVAATLPESLARDVMRYHWRIKFLVDQKARHGPVGVHPKLLGEAEQLRDNILAQLDGLITGRGYITWTAGEINAEDIKKLVLEVWEKGDSVKGVRVVENDGET